MKKSNPIRAESNPASNVKNSQVVIPSLDMDQVASTNHAVVNNFISVDQLDLTKSSVDLIDTTNLQQTELQNQPKSRADKANNGITPAKCFESGPVGPAAMTTIQKYQSATAQQMQEKKSQPQPEFRKKLPALGLRNSIQSATKVLESNSSYQKKEKKVVSILSDSERKQMRKRKPRGSIVFNLEGGSKENQFVSNAAENDEVTTPGVESELAIYQEMYKMSSVKTDMAFAGLAQDRKTTAERRAQSSTQPGRGGNSNSRGDSQRAGDGGMNLVTIESRSSNLDTSNKVGDLAQKDQRVQILVADEDTDSNDVPFLMANQKSLEGDQQNLNSYNNNMNVQQRNKQIVTHNGKKQIVTSSSQAILPNMKIKEKKHSTAAKTSQCMIRAKSTSNMQPLQQVSSSKPKRQHTNSGSKQMMKAMSVELSNSLPKPISINSGKAQSLVVLQNSSRNNLIQPTAIAVEKFGTEDQQAHANQNFNVADQKSIFSPNAVTSQIMSEPDPTHQLHDHKETPGKVVYPSSNIEKRIQKFDEMIESLKQQMLDGTITQHVYTKRYERLVKEKYAVKEEADQKQRNKQYKKDKEQERQRKLSNQPNWQKQTALFFPSSQHTTQNSARKASERGGARQEQQRASVGDRGGMKQLKSFEALSRVPNKIMQHTLSQPTLMSKFNTNSTIQNTKRTESTKSGSQNHKLIDSINLRSKETTGSSLFKTNSETKNKVEGVGDQYRKGMNHLMILIQDKHGLSQLQQHRGQRNLKSSFQQPQTLMDDLMSTNINFQIPDKENPAGQKRPLATRQPGSSLPSKLAFKDTQGNSMIKNIQRRQGEIKVEDMDDTEWTNLYETDQVKMQKVMMLGKETKKANQYLDKFVTLQAEYSKNRGGIAENEYVTDKKSITLPHLLNQDSSCITAESYAHGETISGKMTPHAQKLVKNQTKIFRKTQSFSSFENQLQTITQKADKTGNINSKILDLIACPEMAKYPDYPKTAIRAYQTEVKTLMYELKRCMNRQALIQTLESTSSTSEHVKNENIELISRLPIQFRVAIKERVAPLRLRFDFYDTQTKKKLKNPDTVVCISPTIQCPTLDTAQITKTDFKDPYVVLYREMQGKVFPELLPQNKKEKFPQQVYLSLQSMTGCLCTITVSFPFEKKVLSKFNSKQSQQKRKQAGTQNQMSKQEEYFQEFQDIDKDPAIKNSYRETYKLKAKFIKEEIQRCTDSTSYVPEVMKRAEERKDINRKLRKERIEELKTQRAEEAREVLNHFIGRQHSLRSASQSAGSVDDLLAHSRSARILAVANAQAAGPLNAADAIEHQRLKRDLKMSQAKELRRIQFDEKQKRRMLFVVKQDLVAAYKKEQFSKTEEQLRMNKLASSWAKRILIWNVIKSVFENYDEMLKRKKIAQKMEASAQFLVAMAKRYYRNAAGQWGKGVKQRIQTRIGQSLLLPYYCKRDKAEEVSKRKMLRFLETMACRNNLGDRILKVTKAVKMVERCWLSWKFKFIVRQALLKETMRHSMHEWQKMAHVAVGKKLILKEEKNEIMMSSQKLQENERILNKNLILFAKLVRFETIIRNIYARIELETQRATRILKNIANEEREEREMMGFSESTQQTQTDSDDASDQNDQEESKQSRKVQAKLLTRQLSIKEQRKQNRKARKREAEKIVKKMAKWRTSGFLVRIEEAQDKIIKEVGQLDSDPYNYAIFCWKGMEGYEEIRKNAIQYRQKVKGFKEKKDSKALIKQLRQKYSKQQATLVRASFKRWLNRRQDEYSKKLNEYLQKLDDAELDKSAQKHILVKGAMTGSDIYPPRRTQPEELAFMFMRVMDEISKSNKKTKKISKQQTSVQKRLDYARNDSMTTNMVNTVTFNSGTINTMNTITEEMSHSKL